jgi:hypothetical protein
MTLKEAFLGLFGIACTKDAFVADHMEFPGGFIWWNCELCLNGSLFGDGLFGLFFRVLYLGRVSREGGEKLW